MKNWQKVKAFLKDTNNVNVEQWTKCEWFCLQEVEAVYYFELLGMRYGDVNAVTQESLNLSVKWFIVKSCKLQSNIT